MLLGWENVMNTNFHEMYLRVNPIVLFLQQFEWRLLQLFQIGWYVECARMESFRDPIDFDVIVEGLQQYLGYAHEIAASLRKIRKKL